MKRPDKQDNKYWPTTRDFDHINYSYDINLYIDHLKEQDNKANEFILDIAKLLGINTDGIGYDDLKLSIEDFEEAINKLKEQ